MTCVCKPEDLRHYQYETIAPGYCYDMETGELINPPPEMAQRMDAALRRSRRRICAFCHCPIKESQ